MNAFFSSFILLCFFITTSCVLINACSEWSSAPNDLTANDLSPSKTMACDACHAYPLTDRNHDYHLTTASGNRLLNGPITCLDCHTHSLRSQTAVFFDTVYQDTATGEKSFTSLHPGATDRNSEGRIIRSLALIQVDTLRQNHPIAQPDRPGAHPLFQEYVTSLAHLNGVVDVAFNSRNSDPAQYGGDSASFDPRQETCSAVACHPGGKDYRWAAPHKGLPRLPEETP
jgi:hypothetical protein